MTLRLVVLASGRGSNLQAVLDAIAAGSLDARVAAVFSDRPNAFALERARAAGVRAECVRPREFATRVEFDEHLFSRIDAIQADLIVCAGYMRLISAAQVDAHRGRMLNIHPSLLPAFKGLHTHAQALAAGAPVHGASVHFVTPDLDGGPVIAQARVPVLADDTAETLAQRVLGVEHPLMLATLQLFAAGRVVLHGDAVQLDGVPRAQPLVLGADGTFAA